MPTNENRSDSLANPAVPGPFTISEVVYAAPGLNYSGNQDLAQYIVFQTPTADYQTRTLDISDFSDLPASPTWPFTAANVPVNGLLRVPEGAGPFPLCLIVHGNHSPEENSTPGYIYLLELLASHGIIAGSVDCNFLNGFIGGENDARAIVHLEHIKQFQLWNEQTDHPLFGKVDLSNVMIAGHSRGGEGVGHASSFNRLDSVVPDLGDPPVPIDGSTGLGPYHFNLNAVVAIAPTENQYEPVDGPVVIRDNYIILHGSRDGDVRDFQGYQTYDRAHLIDLDNPTQEAEGFKALLWIYGANHNFFNSVWGPDPIDNPFISRSEQENVAKVYLSAIAQGTLLGRSQYLELLKDFQLSHENGWIPDTISLVNQYQDPQRLFIAHYEEDRHLTTISPPVNGSIDTSNIAALELYFNQRSSGNLYQETNGLKADWDVSGKSYVINLNPGGLPTGDLDFLALRTGQSNDSKNLVDQLQNFTITLSDGTHSYSVKAANIAPLLYPDYINAGARRSVMQTLRIPLSLFAQQGVDVSNIRQITFLFDEPIVGTTTYSGSLYFDEIQLTH
ncbi:MAG: hypothetical protein F6K14_04165 [Symploca sp. SIO2C1]|nr:hypothetical protein [Symploca sp. SIO2C1]